MTTRVWSWMAHCRYSVRELRQIGHVPMTSVLQRSPGRRVTISSMGPQRALRRALATYGCGDQMEFYNYDYSMEGRTKDFVDHLRDNEIALEPWSAMYLPSPSFVIMGFSNPADAILAKMLL